MAEAFKKRGLDVTILEKMGDILPTVSSSMKEPIIKEMAAKGVTLKLNSGVTEVKSASDLDFINRITVPAFFSPLHGQRHSHCKRTNPSKKHSKGN